MSQPLSRAALEAHFLRNGRDHFQRGTDEYNEFNGTGHAHPSIRVRTRARRPAYVPDACPACRLTRKPDFHEKYRAFQARSAAAAGAKPGAGRSPAPVTLPAAVEGPAPPPGLAPAAPAAIPEALRDLPRDYNERYRLDFAIQTQPIPPVWAVTPTWENQAKDFRMTLHLFEDFLQRKRFGQLRKSIQVRAFASETRAGTAEGVAG